MDYYKQLLVRFVLFVIHKDPSFTYNLSFKIILILAISQSIAYNQGTHIIYLIFIKEIDKFCR